MPAGAPRGALLRGEPRLGVLFEEGLELLAVGDGHGGDRASALRREEDE